MGDGEKVARAGRQERKDYRFGRCARATRTVGVRLVRQDRSGPGTRWRCRNAGTSQSPTSASRSGSAIGASRSARRAAVSASKRAERRPSPTATHAQVARGLQSRRPVMGPWPYRLERGRRGDDAGVVAEATDDLQPDGETGSGETARSGSRPASTCSRRAASRTLRARGPCWLKWFTDVGSPGPACRGTRPRVGLMP